MFKKLKEKLSEEVQQGVQQLSQLKAFSVGTLDEDNNHQPVNNQSDELLVDISSIQPAGFNKELFSIDEDSSEGVLLPNSEFQTIELSEECENSTVSPVQPNSQLTTPFEPGTLSFVRNQKRRISESSNISDASNLFPIYDTPNVSFSYPQSDVESCVSEWDETSSPIDKIGKDTIFQGYIRMKQRYHKYKGRYADLSQAYKENEKEMTKIKDVLTKTQDKAVRRIAELREQCTLAQQAKAHLEQELRSDLEEKDHKITALQTKVKLLHDGCLNEMSIKTPSKTESGQEDEKISPEDSLQSIPIIQHEDSSLVVEPHEDGDSFSVGSFSSVSAAQLTMESEEFIEKLKGDLTRHKDLLFRCKENIRTNKEKICELLHEQELSSSQLQEKNSYIESIKIDHVNELENLRATVESSALSMAETKQQMFEELKTKESEVERYRSQVVNLQTEVKNMKFQVNQESTTEEEINMNGLNDVEVDVNSLADKCKGLEELVCNLQETKMSLELKLQSMSSAATAGTNETRMAEERSLNSDFEMYKQKMEEDVSKLNEELKLSQRKCNEVNSDYANLKKSHNELEICKKSKEGYITDLVMQIECERNHNNEHKNNIESMQKQLGLLDKKTAHLLDDNSSLDYYKEKLNQLEIDAKNYVTAQEKMSEVIESKDSTISGLQKQNRNMNGLLEQIKTIKLNHSCLKDQYIQFQFDLSSGKDALAITSEQLQNSEIKLSTAEKNIEEMSQRLKERQDKDKEFIVLRENLLRNEAEIRSFNSEIHILKQQISHEETKKFEMQESLCKYIDGFSKYLGNEYNPALSIEDSFDLIIQRNENILDRFTEVTTSQKEYVQKITQKDSRIEEMNDLMIDKDKCLQSALKQLSHLQNFLTLKEEQNDGLEIELNLLKQTNEELTVNQMDVLNKTTEIDLERKMATEEFESIKNKLLNTQLEKDNLIMKIEQLEAQLNENNLHDANNKQILNENNSIINQLKLEIGSKETELTNYLSSISELENLKLKYEFDLNENKSLLNIKEEIIQEKCRELISQKTELEDLSLQVSNFESSSKQNISHVGELQDKLNSIVQSNSVEVNKLTEALSTEQRKLSEIERQNDEYMVNSKREFDSERLHLEHLLKERNSKLFDLQEQQVNLTAKMEKVDETKKEYEESRKLLTDKIRNMELQATKMDENDQSLSDEISGLKDQLTNEETIRREFESKIEDLTKEKEILNKELSDRIKENESQLEKNLNEQQERENLINSLTQQISTHENNRDKQISLINEMKEKNRQLDKQLIENTDNIQKEKQSLILSNEENSLLKSKITEFTELGRSNAHVIEEKRGLESKLEEIWCENCLLKDEIKILNGTNEKQKDFCDKEQKAKENLTIELNTLREICSKYETDIKTITEKSETYSKQVEDSSSAIRNINVEKNSLLAEISELRKLKSEFNKAQDLICDLKLSETNLRESLQKEKNTNYEISQNITKLSAEVNILNDDKLQYANSHKELQVTCTNLGISSDCDALDIKNIITNLVKDRDKLNTSLNEQLIIKERHCADNDTHLNELVVVNNDLYDKAKELEAANNDLSAKTKELEAANNIILSKERELQCTNNDLSTKAKELEAANNNMTVETKELKAANNDLSAKTKELEAANNIILSKERELQCMNNDLSTKAKELEAAGNNISAQTKNLEAANNDLSVKETELVNLLKRTNNLEDILKNAESMKTETIKLKSETSKEPSFSKEELEDRIALVKSEVRAHYERVIENFKEVHSNEQKEWNSTWEMKYRDIEINYENRIEQISNEWSNERKELEKLTTVAAEAFKNGTDSVDLLKKQVHNQRKEIDDMKQIHRKEIIRIQNQAQSANFRNGNRNVCIGTPLESSAEFDYLKNILYEYMTGKETQTLSKVLCAVVNFDQDQQRKILEFEEQKKSVINNISNSLKAG